MKRLRFGITAKITLIFVLLSIVVLVIVSVLAFNSGNAALQAATTASLLSTAIEKQAALQAWVAEAQSHVAVLAASPQLQASVATLSLSALGSASAQAAHEQLVSELKIWTGQGLRFLALLVLDPESGKVLASTDTGEEGKLREDVPYFVNGKRGPYVQNPYYDLARRAPAMTAAAPMVSADGHVLAVLAGHLDLAEMNAIIGRRTGLHQTDDTFLVNTSSLPVTQPRFISDPAVLQRGIHTDLVKRCLARNSGAMAARDYRGVPMFAVYRWLPERQLCLVTKVDQAEALAPSQAFREQLTLTGGLVLLLALVLAGVLARTITRPITTLQAGVARFGQGELGVRLPETSGDELGLLAREFNKMAASLAEKEAHLRAYAGQLEQRVEERTAALRASNADLEQFAYVASHDLQEPLRMVSSYVQLLARRYKGQLDADADEFITYAVEGASRMQRLINDLLGYSRLSTHGKSFKQVSCEIVLDQVLGNLQLAIEENRGIITHDPLPSVMADEGQLIQLFQNLLSNALKFRGEEPSQIHISAAQQGKEWVFSVRDNGLGFEPQYAERIFVIFQRLHAREDYPGTGIGLAICKKIVERHGGRIWVESAPGQGTTFFFTIPGKHEEQEHG